MYLTVGDASAGARPSIALPQGLGYLDDGDIIAFSSDGVRANVLWRASSSTNSVLLTERCDNFCIMCSQPPRDRDDSWLLDETFELLRLLPDDVAEIGFTGGEPTIYGDDFIELMRSCRDLHPGSEIHVLSNGRRFSDISFAQAYADVANPRLMVGIPLYGAEATLHDYVVQREGAFDETVRGILNLGRLGQRVELRVVLQQATAPHVVAIAEFIARNLPFVEHVALMGLEMMGFARSNIDDVWIDPYEYRTALAEAVQQLQARRVPVFVFNHQLCVLDRRTWRVAVRSISDWKNEYVEVCKSCAVQAECGGFFSSSALRMSEHIQAVKTSERAHLTGSGRRESAGAPVAIRRPALVALASNAPGR